MGEAEAPLLVFSPAGTHDSPMIQATNPVFHLSIHPVCLADGDCQYNLTHFIEGIWRIGSGEALTPVNQQLLGEPLSLKREVKHSVLWIGNVAMGAWISSQTCSCQKRTDYYTTELRHCRHLHTPLSLSSHWKGPLECKVVFVLEI